MSRPKQTSDIFEILNKGQFICSNSSDEKIRRLYNVIDENFEDLYDFFRDINFILEKEDEYFLFTRRENKVDIERKLVELRGQLADFFGVTLGVPRNMQWRV